MFKFFFRNMDTFRVLSDLKHYLLYFKNRQYQIIVDNGDDIVPNSIKKLKLNQFCLHFLDYF